jgi:predicted NBD/HSP70 family sugar kinase
MTIGTGVAFVKVLGKNFIEKGEKNSCGAADRGFRGETQPGRCDFETGGPVSIASRIRTNRRPRVNEQQMLRLIRDLGPSSRAELVRQLGLSTPTVAKAANSLLRAGLLEEVEDSEITIGRPAKLLRLACATAQVLGIVIAPGTSWVVSAGLDGELSEDRMRKVRTPETYEQLIGALVQLARELMVTPGLPTLGAGICVPGLLDLRRSLSSANLHAIEGHCPADDLAQHLGIECVTLQGKHALCMAESHFGEARGLSDFVMLDFSTAVGMSAVGNGRLLVGKNGFAGEVGHLMVEPDGPLCGCGNRGCLQTLASDSALSSRVSKRIGRDVEIDEVVELTRSGTLDLSDEIDKVVRHVSMFLATVINIFNPSTLFLHGRLFDLADDLLPRLLAETGRRALRPIFQECRILRASGNKRRGAVAAILEHLIESLAPAARTVY